MNKGKSLFVSSQKKNDEKPHVEVGDPTQALIRISDIQNVDPNQMKEWASKLNLSELRIICRSSQLAELDLLYIPTKSLSLHLDIDSDIPDQIQVEEVELNLTGSFYLNIRADVVGYYSCKYLDEDSPRGLIGTVIGTSSKSFEENMEGVKRFVRCGKVRIGFSSVATSAGWHETIDGWEISYKRYGNVYEFN